MRIYFKKLEIHNFMSYNDEVFEFDKHKGLNLICGLNRDIPGSKNGSGKSNLGNALVYGLFGEMPFKLKNENISNRYVDDKTTRICVYFDVNKNHYKIVTGLKRKQSYCNLYEIVKGDEKDITKSTIVETRNFIEKEILHCDINIFMRTIMLNSDPTYNFYNLSHKDKKEFIDKIFDISIFGDMFNIIHRDNLRSEKDIIAHQNKLIIYNRNREEYQKKSSEFETNSKNEIQLLNEKLTTAQTDLSARSNAIVERNTELITKCKKAIDQLTTLNNENDILIKKNTVEINGLNRDISRINSSIADKQNIINEHSNLYAKLCDDCKPIFSKHYNLDKLSSDISEMTEQKKNISEKILELSKDNTARSHKVTENSTKLSKLNKKTIELNSDYEKSQRELKIFEAEVNTLIAQINDIKETKNPYIDLIADNDNNISTENKTLEDILNKYKYTQFAETIVDQDTLKKFIIKDMIGILNNKIKYYLHKLGANYDIVFDSEMNYDFITQNRTGAEFHNFSSGEQARISIATCFAFRDFLSTRSNISSNILILDEFVDSNVDSLAIDNTLEILEEFVKHNKQNVFIVSHRSEINNYMFDEVIRVEKQNNISSIKYISSK